jgi:tRNA (cmo5U34)-methyltransferase
VSTRLVVPGEWTFRDVSVAAHFDQHVQEQLPWYRLATGVVAHIARHYLPEQGLIYDVGASTGNIGRALETTIAARDARLVSIEASPDMAARYDGVQPENLVVERAEAFAFEPYDVAVVFLTMMFIPVAERLGFLQRLFAQARPGGVVIVLDKTQSANGYAATVMWRMALAGKVATGVDPLEIVQKELSLGGVQRPFDPAMLRTASNLFPVEFFRFGEFAGWFVER